MEWREKGKGGGRQEGKGVRDEDGGGGGLGPSTAIFWS